MLHLVDAGSVPSPKPDLEQVIAKRVQSALAAEHRRAWPAMRIVGWAAVVGLVLGGGYLWGRWDALRERPANPSSTQAIAPNTGEDVMLAALDQHFDETEVLLVELLNAQEDVRDFTYERTAASNLVASGRLYRATARQNGNAELAALLDDLESVLVEVARSPAKVDEREVDTWRTRIDQSELLRKVRTVEDHIKRRRDGRL
jgi:hypothetical protein